MIQYSLDSPIIYFVGPQFRIFIFCTFGVVFVLSNSVDPDAMHYVASQLGLCCLVMHLFTAFTSRKGQACKCSTVSHFSYAPPFQGPHFSTNMLKSNILYENLVFDTLSVR